MPHHLISDAHECIINEIPHCPQILYYRETTSKGMGLEELAGKEDPHVELDSSPNPFIVWEN
jgi:hypothetical protein